MTRHVMQFFHITVKATQKKKLNIKNNLCLIGKATTKHKLLT